MTLYQIIKTLQTTQGAKAKLAVLESHKDNDLLKAYLKAVYDPRINYYQTAIPKMETGDVDFSEDNLKELEVLSNRTLTGRAAKMHLNGLFLLATPEAQELMGYIIKRDIKASVGEGTILKVWDDLFFIPPYQRCAGMTDKLVAKFASMPYFFVQTKSDGVFAYAIKSRTSPPEAITRAGSVYPQWIADHITKNVPDGMVGIGELLVYRDGKMLDRKTGNGILNAILQGDEKGKFDPATMEVRYVAWDLITESEFDVGYSSRRYEDRLYYLQYATAMEVTDSWKVSSIEEAYRIQTDHLDRGLEGTVWKSAELGWRDCSSGDPDMMKAKLVFQADFEIEGAYEGEGKYEGMLGGFNLKSRDGLIKFNVGSGLSDAFRKGWWQEYLKDDTNAFNGRICAIEGNDIVTSRGKDTESIFLPIFLELRIDKTVADTREQVYAAFNDAKLGKKMAGK